jgi:hypothetical protein
VTQPATKAQMNNWVSKLLKIIAPNPKWEKDELIYLKGRPNSENEYRKIFGDEFAIADKVLTAIAESFDIIEKQKYLISPSDSVQKLYREVALGESHDDMEIERLLLSLKSYLSSSHFDSKTLEQFGTVEELIREVLEVIRSTGRPN